MRTLLAILFTILVAGIAQAESRRCPFNSACTINLNLIEVDGIDMRVDAVCATGDILQSDDEGTEASTGDCFTDEGSTYSYTVTCNAARCMLTFIDQTATKVWLDTSISIETYHATSASAQHTMGVDVTAISGDTTAADNAELDFDGTGYAKANSTVGTVTTLTGHTAQTGDSYARLGAPAGASVSADVAAVKVDTAAVLVDTGTAGVLLAATATSAQLVDDVWDETLTGANHNGTNSAGRRLRQVDAAFIISEDTAQSATATTITLAAGENATNDIYAGDRVQITAGTGSGEHGIVTSYVGSTKVATMSQSWVITPDATSEYILVPADVDVETWQHVVVTADATTSKPDVNVYSVSGDATAADNLELDYDGTGYGKTNSTIGWNAAWDTEVESEANDALVGQKLDHLVAVADADDVVDNAILAKLANSGATADWSLYVNTTDSLMALRDRGDAAWTTGGGGSISDILNVIPNIPESIDLANTATYRLGITLLNSLDDLPTTAEITPGTISIDRKAIGGTSWSAVVTDSAMSESAGLIYYDEVFDSGTGYAEGDSIRVTIKSQKITVAANDYEISDATGRIFYTEIRQTMRGTDSAVLASSYVAQTGDSYARIGAPAGASVSADIAAVKVDTAATLVDTAEIGAAGAGLTAVATAASIAALNDISAANVNTEVADVLTVDTNAELSALPGASPTILQLIQFLYQSIRFKETVTATTKTIYKDDGTTTLGTSTLSDDGTTFTRGEIN